VPLDAIVYEYTAVENNVNVIYREIYFYIRCTMLSVEQEQALSPAIPGHNFAVLGQAGFGKTHIVKTIGERLKRAGKRVAFTCTTGIDL
jgi:DNA replication protein DnaC